MPEKIYRTGIYARLSREDNEHGESNSISSQKAICMEYISRHPDLELVEIYDEDIVDSVAELQNLLLQNS